MQKHADKIAAIHAEFDDKVAELLTLSQRLTNEYEMAATNARGIGSLRIKKALWRVRALAGRVADVGVLSSDIHIDGHKMADEAGLKTPPLSRAAGVHLMGGGDR